MMEPLFCRAASSTDFAGACSGAKASSVGPGSGSVSPSPDFSMVWPAAFQKDGKELRRSDLIGIRPCMSSPPKPFRSAILLDIANNSSRRLS
jgi:hypothetical protein